MTEDLVLFLRGMGGVLPLPPLPPLAVLVLEKEVDRRRVFVQSMISVPPAGTGVWLRL